jgi:hypothetical protein
MRFRLLAQRNPVDAAASHSRISLFRYILDADLLTGVTTCPPIPSFKRTTALFMPQ